MISKSLSFSGQTTDTDERQENRESVSDEEPKHENILLRMKGSRIVAKDLGQPTTSVFSRVMACDPNKCISRGCHFREEGAVLGTI